MTEPVAPARPKASRRVAMLAAAGVLGALSPVALAAPATAAPSSAPCPAGLGATAASETLALRLLDPRSLGTALPRLADVHAATTHSGMAGGPTRAAAEAKLLRAKILGQPLAADVLGTRAYQKAPEPHAQPTVVPAKGLDLGAARLGAGELSAHATWKGAAPCTPDGGPRAVSRAKLLNADVLRGPGDRSLVRLGAVGSSTVTDVSDERPTAAATATGDLANFSLLAGSPSAVGVQVVSQPALRVSAGAKKTATYEAPVLKVTIPGKRDTVTLSAPGSHVDVVVPVDEAGRGLAGDLGRAEGLPVLTTPLTTLLSGLTAPSVPSGSSGLSGSSMPSGSSGLSGEASASTEAGGAASADVNGAASAGSATESGPGTGGPLGDLPGVPALGGVIGGLIDDDTHAAPAPQPENAANGRVVSANGRVVVVRLALGEFGKRTTATGIHAKAVSVRIKVLVRTKWAGHDGGDGYGGKAPADRTTLLDLDLCKLEAAAASPSGGGYGSGSGSGGESGGGSGGGGQSSGSLPVTGNKVNLILASGTMLVIVGRLLMLAARRRFGD